MRLSVPLILLGFLAILVISWPYQSYAKNELKTDPTLSDGLAFVAQVKGYATIAKSGSPIEKKIKAGDKIEPGDAVYTGSGATVQIHFDRNKLNAVQIPSDSKVIFKAIEPTNIQIEDGTVFNIVDGLPKGSQWKVSTPSTVAAVRGTVFMVQYILSSQEFYAATAPISDDGKNSAINIESLANGGTIDLVEGKEISLKADESIDLENVKDMNPKFMAEVLGFYQAVLAERAMEAEQRPEDPAMPEEMAEVKQTMCDANGQNCGVKTCKQTAAGEICSFS